MDLLWSLALRARTILSAFISQADIFYLMSGSFFITRGPLPAARADFPRSSFERTTPSRTPTIFIIEYPGGYFRETFASHVDPSLDKWIFFIADLVRHIYHDTYKPS